MLVVPKNNETLIGNQKFEGFCIDLLEKIAKLCNFTYEIREVNDGQHGSFSFITNKWNGIVGEIIEKVKFFKNRILKLSLRVFFFRKVAINFQLFQFNICIFLFLNF